jgi:hypothetical protein
LKKLMLLAALLAMLAVAVAPALAQVATQEGEQGAESGDLNQRSDVTGGGDNSIQCANPQIAGNTGNAQNQDQVIQYASEGGFGFGDSATITVNPNEEVNGDIFTCTAAVNQAASASG